MERGCFFGPISGCSLDTLASQEHKKRSIGNLSRRITLYHYAPPQEKLGHAGVGLLVSERPEPG